MLRKKPEKQADDELTLRLRAAARHKRPWSWSSFLVLIAILLVPVGVIVWTLLPRSEPPQITVTAFDQIALPNAQLTLRARIEALEGTSTKPDLDGYELLFDAGDQAKTVAVGKATTDAAGEATLAWQPPAGATLAVFTAQYPGDKRRGRSASQGKIHIVDPGAAVLIVDMAALTNATPAQWRSENVLKIRAAAGAGAALKAAQDRNYRIVYLAASADSGPLYAKMRGWIESQWAAAERLPPGPVLAALGQSTPGDVVADLKTRIGGPLVAVAGNAQTVRALPRFGARLFILGGDAGADATSIESWRELDGQLAK